MTLATAPLSSARRAIDIEHPVATRVLLTGASGFIGSAVVEALTAAGHELVLAVRDVDAARRRWPGCRAIAVDFGRDHAAGDWRARLAGIDAVLNTVGLFREAGEQTFQSIHVRAPMALFDACVECGVGRVVQLSALGADEAASSDYHRGKKQADAYLLGLPLSACVLQPPLVFGAAGASSRLFMRLAALPLLALPRGGRQCVQPVHVDDLVAAVLAVLESPRPPSRLAVVGPQPLQLRDYLRCLRRQLGLSRGTVVPVPMWLAAPAARIAGVRPGSLLDADALAMLERGNCADAAPLAELLDRAPRRREHFVPAGAAPMLREHVLLEPALSLLRWSIALVWIVTGIMSLGIHPVADNLQLLARSGVPPSLAPFALYAAAVLDIVLGVAMSPHRHTVDGCTGCRSC